MSYACIKISVSCPRHPLQSAVNVKDILHYTPEFKKNKLFHVKCGPSTCVGKIAYVCDTLQEVQSTMSKKRSIVPPRKFMDSASEIESDIRKDCPKNANVSNKETASFDKILADKLYQNREKYKDENFAKKPKITCVKKTSIDLRTSKKIEDKDQNANNERYDDSDSETDDNYRVQDPIDSEITEVSRVDSEIERAKKEINNLKNENIQLKNLNLNLQRILCREFGVNVMGKENEKENDNGEVLVKVEKAVGKINRNNDTVHLGHDVWIPVDKWNSVMINSGNSASLFSRNLSRCIFGEEVLKRSSITGKSSNRASVKETRDRLDPTSISAVQSAFEFWATTQLKPPFNSVNMQHYKICIPTYIGKFCDDLRQPPEKWRKKKRVAPLTVEQEEIAKEFNEINSNHPNEEIIMNATSSEFTRSHTTDPFEIVEAEELEDD